MSAKEYGARARPFYEDLIVRKPDGSTEGRDPSELPKELMLLAYTPAPLLKIIRDKCLDCCCYQPSEIRKCSSVGCALWPYRIGRNPFSNRKGNPASLAKSRPDARNLPVLPEGGLDIAPRHCPEKPSPGAGNSAGVAPDAGRHKAGR
jgi:hypothetical protein